MDVASFPFACREGPDNSILVDVQYLNEKASFTPEQLVAMLIVDLKAIAEVCRRSGRRPNLGSAACSDVTAMRPGPGLLRAIALPASRARALSEAAVARRTTAAPSRTACSACQSTSRRPSATPC